MKTTYLISMILALVMSACTLPADDAGETPVAEQLDELESFATEPEVYALDEEPHVPELTYAQCVVACHAGIEAIERFCALIPNPVIQASCLAMRHGGPVVCSNWCYWYFIPH
jgi:hypothetical protein